MTRSAGAQKRVDALWQQVEALSGLDLRSAEGLPPDMRFIDWVDDQAKKGLKVDGHPFDLSKRAALRAIYEAFPATKEEGYGRTFIIMKGAQTGLSVMSFLWLIFLSLKYPSVKVGAYYPDRLLAAYVSSNRFLPIVRSVPEAHEAMLEAEGGQEGNILTRHIGPSEVIFLWTSGGAHSESYPLGAIVADEVQLFSVSDMDRIRERMSASDIRFTLGVSTAFYPDADIDWWYRRGTQNRFHTSCKCPGGVVLDEVFPECIALNEGQYPDAPLDYVYRCPACDAYIEDPQRGEWVVHNPNGQMLIDSWHYPQTLSYTVSPREIITAYSEASDMQSFQNRKMGRPWLDPSQVPVTLDMLNACVAEGIKLGVKWEKSGAGTYAGIDQMGQFSTVIVKRRLEDGRQAVIHVESIYGEDPFARCDELMERYGVAVCCIESLPNYNEAHRFAQRWLGRVFLVSYGDMSDEMLRWGDAVVSKADRKTVADARDRYTCLVDQYRAMQTACARFADQGCVFPDPAGLSQEIMVKGQRKRVLILKDEVFVHLTHVALVTEQVDPAIRKYRRMVKKVSMDPHYAYSNMLADIAWARSHGTASFILPGVTVASKTEAVRKAVEERMPGLPPAVVEMFNAPEGACGACSAFKDGLCQERGCHVGPSDPGCDLYVGR